MQFSKSVPAEMPTPTISVVVPTFNSARFIRDMLDSLAGQTFRDFEVIISDGASKDDTLKIVEGYDLPGLRICSRPDQGIPDALNRGFSLAKGSIFCWLNSDDFYLSPYVLESVKDRYLCYAFQVTYGHSLVTNEDGIVVRELFAHLPLSGFEHAGTNLMTGSLFFSRDSWSKFGGFSGLYLRSFEYELIDFLHKNSVKKILISEFLSGLRIHNDALSQREQAKMIVENREILSGERRWPFLLRKAERYFSLGYQGNLSRVVISKINSSRLGKSWREIYGENV